MTDVSLHIEWDTAYAEVQIYPRGTEFSGYEEPITEDFGVLIGGAGGGALMLEGSLDELTALSDRLRAAIDRQRGELSTVESHQFLGPSAESRNVEQEGSRFWAVTDPPQRDFGDKTVGIVDENEGGIVVYVHDGNALRVIEAFRAFTREV